MRDASVRRWRIYGTRTESSFACERSRFRRTHEITPSSPRARTTLFGAYPQVAFVGLFGSLGRNAGAFQGVAMPSPSSRTRASESIERALLALVATQKLPPTPRLSDLGGVGPRLHAGIGRSSICPHLKDLQDPPGESTWRALDGVHSSS